MSHDHPTDTLTPVARLFLIAIDKDTHRPAGRRRWRFRKAPAMANGTRGPGGAMRARRRAIRELRDAGLVERGGSPGTYPFVPEAGASRAFGKLQRGIEGLDELDGSLLVVLVWTGVLEGRLSHSDRWHVYKRLKIMIDAPPTVEFSAPGGIEPIAQAAGQIVYRQEVGLLHHLVTDLLSGHHDHVLHDLGATHWGAGAAATGGFGDSGPGQQATPGS